MIAVGRFLLHEVPGNESFVWVDNIIADQRIALQYGDIANTKLADNSVNLVNLCLVLHELPAPAAEEILKEAYRILSPGGILAIMEMDPSAPGNTTPCYTPCYCIIYPTLRLLSTLYPLTSTLAHPHPPSDPPSPTL